MMSGSCAKPEMHYGILYGIGIGPGDPELITLKAKRVLEETGVIAVPKSKSEGGSLAMDIVKKVVDIKGKEVIELTFPMKKEKAELAGHWEEAKRRVLKEMKKGRDVAFITIGDPLFHSTFIYLLTAINRDASLIEQHGSSVVVIPGVSSIHAASASANIPLASSDERLAVLPATYETTKLREALLHFDTIVLMKVNRVMDGIIALLKELKLKGKAVFVSRAGWPEEEVIYDLDSLKGRALDYFSMVIVRK